MLSGGGPTPADDAKTQQRRAEQDQRRRLGDQSIGCVERAEPSVRAVYTWLIKDHIDEERVAGVQLCADRRFEVDLVRGAARSDRPFHAAGIADVEACRLVVTARER